MVELPVLLHSRVRLVATIENTPNVTNIWFRDGLAIPGQSGSELDVGFPASDSQPVYHLMVADPNGQRVYSGIRLQPIEPHSPSVRVARFTESGGFQSFVSVWSGRRYRVDVTEGLETGNSWRWFSNLIPASATELPLATLPWSESVPRRFYRIMEVY